MKIQIDRCLYLERMSDSLDYYVTVDGCGPAFSTNSPPDFVSSSAPSSASFGKGAVSKFNGIQPVQRRQQLTNALGGDIRAANPLIANPRGMISAASQLVCTTWSRDCRWHNERTTDKLDWATGLGTPDSFRFQASTDTRELPEAPFGVALSSSILAPEDSAYLVSDPLPCQVGDAEIRLKYWTSPFVQLLICRRTLGSRTFSYCSPPITNGDPGPAFINIPGSIRGPFEIVIQARNFVYSAGGFDGGFLLIDDLSYIGSLCDSAGFNAGSGRTDIELNSNLQQLSALTLESGNNTDACEILTCTFSTGNCVRYIKSSAWKIQQGSIGNPLTGIRGDGSDLPYNPNGIFAYAEGPGSKLRLETPAFRLNKTANLMFAYYKASADTSFEVFSSRPGEGERSIFRSPLVNRDSRRWFRELRQLLAGDYNKLIFEADRLRPNTYVGLDEIALVDRDGTSYC